jgi:hypothetical protein
MRQMLLEIADKILDTYAKGAPLDAVRATYGVEPTKQALAFLVRCGFVDADTGALVK